MMPECPDVSLLNESCCEPLTAVSEQIQDVEFISMTEGGKLPGLYAPDRPVLLSRLVYVTGGLLALRFTEYDPVDLRGANPSDIVLLGSDQFPPREMVFDSSQRLLFLHNTDVSRAYLVQLVFQGPCLFGPALFSFCFCFYQRKQKENSSSSWHTSSPTVYSHFHPTLKTHTHFSFSSFSLSFPTFLIC